MRTAKYKQAMQLQFTLLEDQRNRFSYIYNNVYNIVCTLRHLTIRSYIRSTIRLYLWPKTG